MAHHFNRSLLTVQVKFAHDKTLESSADYGSNSQLEIHCTDGRVWFCTWL